MLWCLALHTKHVGKCKIEGTQPLQQNYNMNLRAVLIGKYAGMHDNYMQCLWIHVCGDVHKHQPWVQLESAGSLQAACVLLLAWVWFRSTCSTVLWLLLAKLVGAFLSSMFCWARMEDEKEQLLDSPLRLSEEESDITYVQDERIPSWRSPFGTKLNWLFFLLLIATNVAWALGFFWTYENHVNASAQTCELYFITTLNWYMNKD